MSQISLFEGNAPLKITKPIRLIELFSGIGAQASALEAMGIDFEHYRTCDFEPRAVQSYNNIHGTDFVAMDIKDMKGADLGIVDKNKYAYILTYSFPCTDLSLAGKRAGMREGSGTSSSLLWEVKRLLTETNELPDVLLMENVPAVIHETNLPEFNRWVLFLENIGYISKYECLNAKEYGVPQNRDRCYMVSWLDNPEIGNGGAYYEFPKPIPLNRRVKDILEQDVEERYYLSRDAVKKLESGIGASGEADADDEMTREEVEDMMRFGHAETHETVEKSNPSRPR